MTDAAKKLEADKIESRQIKPFRFNILAIAKKWGELTFDKPLDGFKWCLGKAESMTKPLMTGYFSLVTLPLSLIVRGGAEVAFNTIRRKKWYAALAGAGSVVFTSWMIGSALYAKGIAMAGTAALAGQIGVGVAAGVATLPFLPFAAAAGVALTGILLGVGAAGVSILHAVDNLGVAWNRTKDRIRGIRYTEDELGGNGIESAIRADRDDSLSERIQYDFWNLSPKAQRETLTYLQRTFEQASARRKEETAEDVGVAPAPQPQPKA